MFDRILTRRRFIPARSVPGRPSLSFQSFHHTSREEADMIRIFTTIAAAGLFLGLLAGSTAPATAQFSIQDSTQESIASPSHLSPHPNGTLYVMPAGCV